jgi:hypothetical protein
MYDAELASQFRGLGILGLAGHRHKFSLGFELLLTGARGGWVSGISTEGPGEAVEVDPVPPLAGPEDFPICSWAAALADSELSDSCTVFVRRPSSLEEAG